MSFSGTTGSSSQHDGKAPSWSPGESPRLQSAPSILATRFSLYPDSWKRWHRPRDQAYCYAPARFRKISPTRGGKRLLTCLSPFPCGTATISPTNIIWLPEPRMLNPRCSRPLVLRIPSFVSRLPKVVDLVYVERNTITKSQSLGQLFESHWCGISLSICASPRFLNTVCDFGICRSAILSDLPFLGKEDPKHRYLTRNAISEAAGKSASHSNANGPSLLLSTFMLRTGILRSGHVFGSVVYWIGIGIYVPSLCDARYLSRMEFATLLQHFSTFTSSQSHSATTTTSSTQSSP